MRALTFETSFEVHTPTLDLICKYPGDPARKPVIRYSYCLRKKICQERKISQLEYKKNSAAVAKCFPAEICYGNFIVTFQGIFSTILLATVAIPLSLEALKT